MSYQWWRKVEGSGEWSTFMKGLRNVKPQTFNPKPRYPDMGRIIYLDIGFVKPLNTAQKCRKM